MGIQQDMFVRMVQSVARVNGAPQHRRAFVPYITEKSPADLREFIEGVDAITGRPFMQEVLEQLTEPLPEVKGQTLTFERSTPRFLPEDTEDNLRALFEENRWTDFLPIVLPTEQRVAAMMAGSSHGPDEVVGRLRPTRYRELWESTVEKVAVNAVMAGARPEYFPVILALASSGWTARISSISSAAGLAVVNGPIRNEIGMNSKIGALGPYNHANSTIGRAWGLLCQNLQGGSVPGETYMGSMGNTIGYNNLTFAENEERSPWEPLHTRYGFSPGDSTVSVAMALHYNRTYGLREKTWLEKLHDMFRASDPAGGVILLLDPSAARELGEFASLSSGRQAIDWIYENAQMRSEKLWDHWGVDMLWRPQAEAGVEPFAALARTGPDDLIPIFLRDQIEVVVVGGETNASIVVLSGTMRTTCSVDEWR